MTSYVETSADVETIWLVGWWQSDLQFLAVN